MRDFLDNFITNLLIAPFLILAGVVLVALIVKGFRASAGAA